MGKITYQEAVDYIESIPGFTHKNTLDNTRQLLAAVGDPQDRLKVIHVAGTNGKGSVCAYLSQALTESGRQAGLFTSPHLVKINERFRIGQHQITDEEFTEVYETVRAAVDQEMKKGLSHPAYFEFLLVMGFVWYAKSGCEYLVMETGMGGLKDATNVLAAPALTVITSISVDHTEFLGSTIEEIAAHKAGIIKEGVPVVYDATDRKAAAVIEAQAKKMHAEAVPVYPGMAQVEARTDKGIDFVLNNKYYDYKSVHVGFHADYQVMNASVALTAMRVLDREKAFLTNECALKAVADTRWAGRMESVLPGVVLDGAHNADGIEQLLKSVKHLQERGPVNLLFAAVAEKNYDEMIREIVTEGQFSSVVVTQTGGHRQVDADTFADIFRKYTDVPVTVVKDSVEAFKTALEQKAEGGTLLCAGSLYLVGEIEAYLEAKGDNT